MQDALTPEDEIKIILEEAKSMMITCQLCKQRLLDIKLAEHWEKDCSYFKD